MRVMESTSRKLEVSEEKKVLKAKCSWSADVIRSTSSEERSPEAVFIRSIWRSLEAGRLKERQDVVQMKIKSRLSLQKIGRIKQRLFQMDLKALNAYSVESVEKGLLYEVYNHYLHYSVFISASTRTTFVLATVFLRTWNEFEIDPS